MNTAEKRTFSLDSIELRKDEKDDDAPTQITGHAAVFNSLSEPIWGMFREQIKPGAFKKSIKEDDVRALFNHDASIVLGRNDSGGSLRMEEDKKGLKVDITPPDTQAARDVVELIRSGLVSQMSFGFYVRAEEWEFKDEDLDIRTITEAELFDVSPVTYPAYKDTDVSVRGLVEKVRARRATEDELLVFRKMRDFFDAALESRVPAADSKPERPSVDAEILEFWRMQRMAELDNGLPCRV